MGRCGSSAQEVTVGDDQTLLAKEALLWETPAAVQTSNAISPFKLTMQNNNATHTLFLASELSHIVYSKLGHVFQCKVPSLR